MSQFSFENWLLVFLFVCLFYLFRCGVRDCFRDGVLWLTRLCRHGVLPESDTVIMEINIGKSLKWESAQGWNVISFQGTVVVSLSFPVLWVSGIWRLINHFHLGTHEVAPVLSLYDVITQPHSYHLLTHPAVRWRVAMVTLGGGRERERLELRDNLM